MEIYLAYRYFTEEKDSCVIKVFESEKDAMEFKARRNAQLWEGGTADYIYIVPCYIVQI